MVNRYQLFVGILACVVTTSQCSLYESSFEEPEWVFVAQDIINNCNDICDVLDLDAQSFVEYRVLMNQLYQQFEVHDQLRYDLFNALRCMYYTLQMNLLTEQEHHAADMEQAALAQKALEDEIVLLRQEYTAEIDCLQEVIAQLEFDLETLKEAYTLLVNLHGDTGEAVIQSLSKIKNKYQKVAHEKTQFLDVLTIFTDRLQDYFVTSQQEGQVLHDEIGIECGDITN